ncbi:MAG TPA: NAD-dependent epimerase/dehydratase family protein [Acidimicrobiales bacterium]|nr:NAD-dependent epimerase/dehydratase family protein [Acidimicrobiales bacterium]
MRILVTGGAGFIGANLCRRLVTTPQVDHVAVLDDLSTGAAANLDGVDVELVVGSVLDMDVVHGLVERADSVVHLAARPSVPRSIQDPMASHLANATGTMTVLEAARLSGLPQVIVASSSSVYGANPTLPKREDLASRPVSPYAASKLATEAYALAYGHSFGLPTLAFRFFNVFGPLQAANHAYAAVVPAFVDAALHGRPLIVHGDGTQSRDFTFVDSVTAVIERAVTSRLAHPEPVNLAFGSRTTLLELIAEIESILGCRLPRVHVESRAGDVAHSQADATLLRALFPDIEPVALADAVRITVDWFRSFADN